MALTWQYKIAYVNPVHLIERKKTMIVIHPIYGQGVVIKRARGVFAFVKFKKPTNVHSLKGENTLAVSLNVCRKA